MKKSICLSLLLFLLAPAARATVEEARSRITPWSGHWWPMRRGQMVKGYYYDDPAPMRKHDDVTGSNALDWERKHHYDPDYPKWYGHCHAWAAAAATEVEPTREVTYKGVKFHIGDVKALLTEGHYGDKATLFGQRYTGDDCDPDDIYPDQLWKVMQDYIGQQGLPLLMDLDPGKEVWTYPVYAYRIQYDPAGTEPDLYQGEMTLFVANTGVSPEFVGTLPLIKHYQFTVRMKNGVIQEGTGKWIDKSKKDHPDYAWYPAARGQENEGLVHGLAQRLAEMASDRVSEHSSYLAGLAAHADWDRAAGGDLRLSPAIPRHSRSDGDLLVANPALPDLSANQRRQTARRLTARAPARPSLISSSRLAGDRSPLTRIERPGMRPPPL